MFLRIVERQKVCNACNGEDKVYLVKTDCQVSREDKGLFKYGVNFHQ